MHVIYVYERHVAIYCMYAGAQCVCVHKFCKHVINKFQFQFMEFPTSLFFIIVSLNQKFPLRSR